MEEIGELLEKTMGKQILSSEEQDALTRIEIYHEELSRKESLRRAEQAAAHLEQLTKMLEEAVAATENRPKDEVACEYSPQRKEFEEIVEDPDVVLRRIEARNLVSKASEQADREKANQERIQALQKELDDMLLRNTPNERT